MAARDWDATRQPGEPLDDLIARLKNGRWYASERPAQAAGDIWRKIPGGPSVRTRGQVYRARIFRHPPGGGRPELDGCRHGHTTARGARYCAGRWARALNRELARAGNDTEQENGT
jgi:hypothetical protein